MIAKKRVIKKTITYSLVVNLILSIIAISLSMQIVSGATPTQMKDAGFVLDKKTGNWFHTTHKRTFTSQEAKNLNLFSSPAQAQKVPGTTGTPSTHGYAGEGYKAITGGYPLPKGTYYDLTTGATTTSYGGWYSFTGIVQGAWWAFLAYYAVGIIGKLAEWDEAEVEAAQKAAAVGMFTGKAAYSIFGKGGFANIGLSSGWAIGIGVAVAVYTYYDQYEEKTQKTVIFNCYAWDAPVGGDDCKECDKQELPCSEYQCRSLGQACQLLNPGTDEEKCVWVNRNDIKYPIIEPWIDALLDNYTYKPDDTISPPERGVIIESPETDKCVPAFTPLSFGVTLDEPAKCKIDYLRKDTFDDMDFYFGESSLLKYNHTQVMSLPGLSAAEAEGLTIRNDGNFELFVRCQDANGNANTANFVFKYCVDPGPDTTPPEIIGTNPLNGFPIAFNQTSFPIEVYVNEPAECKWSHLDQSYDNMPNENEMECCDSLTEMNAQMLCVCSTTLTGLKDRQENQFYFRCKDQPQPNVKPEDRNVNAESYEFTLIGTQPLIIDSAGPNGTIKDSTDIVKVTLEVKTSAGYNEGEASCYYSESCYKEDGSIDDYTMFGYEGGMSYEHSQDLWMGVGDYECSIKCIDLGGNPDNKTVNFKVETDIYEPIVVRAYHEDTYLKIITNEKAECVYSTFSCSYSFDDAVNNTGMVTSDNINHFTDWNTNIDFYIKCRDEYGKQPNPNECSIIVRPFKIYEDE